MTHLIAPSYWISLATVTMCFFMISFLIIKNEVKIRTEGTIKFTTKSLEYTSISCIISGFIANILFFLMWFDKLCIFSEWLANIFLYIQFSFMGFYQLSRLYYAFANCQIHSHLGYPKWLFIIMFIFGITIFITYSLSMLFSEFGLHSECGINSNLQYYHQQIHNNHQTLTFWGTFVSALLYAVWDLLTLSLYMLKIRLFKKYKKSQPSVYKRISSILYKIAIITLFYDITSLIFVAITSVLWTLNSTQSEWFGWIASVINRTGPVIFGVSMMLMMDYNRGIYHRFLHFIYGAKLYVCCCCCRFMVLEQLEEIDQNMNELSVVVKVDNDKTDETSFPSMDFGDQKTEQIGNDLSVQTHTIQH